MMCPRLRFCRVFWREEFLRGVIDLHEDWESSGFYLYEMFGDRGPLGREMVDAGGTGFVRLTRMPRLRARVAVNGVIHPNMEVARRKYGEGIPIALVQRGHTGHLVTSETPTAQPMDVRVAAHLAAIEVMVEASCLGRRLFSVILLKDGLAHRLGQSFASPVVHNSILRKQTAIRVRRAP